MKPVSWELLLAAPLSVNQQSLRKGWGGGDGMRFLQGEWVSNRL